MEGNTSSALIAQATNTYPRIQLALTSDPLDMPNIPTSKKRDSETFGYTEQMC
jgi:hypothetical protein